MLFTHPSQKFFLWMKSSRMVRASDCQCKTSNSPGLDPSILRQSDIWGRRQMKQCWIKYKNTTKIPLLKTTLLNRGNCRLGFSFWDKTSPTFCSNKRKHKKPLNLKDLSPWIQTGWKAGFPTSENDISTQVHWCKDINITKNCKIGCAENYS